MSNPRPLDDPGSDRPGLRLTPAWGVSGAATTWLRSPLLAALAVVVAVAATVLLDASALGLVLGLSIVLFVGLDVRSQATARRRTLDRLSSALQRAEPIELEPGAADDLASCLRDLAQSWRGLLECRTQALALAQRVQALPAEMNDTFGSIEHAASNQEEVVEETASLVAHMRASMTSIGVQVEQLLRAADESASSVLEMGGSIEEVARNTASLHDVVDASTSSVHEMGASIRQVAEGAEQVQQMAEGTAAAVTQMDRSIQEVSSHALEAAALTQSAHAEAESGSEAVHATIDDIERISARTQEAKERLGGLVSRVSQIGNILSAIDEINDETNLLSLNAAIIAAQAGEQGKAFLVVANHVKTLARRTAESTQDIERLIADIEVESGDAVCAMESGIVAVQTGVERSRTAGEALAAIQEACRDASERVDEIARATAEQSRNSKGVAEATQRTSLHIQQISQAMSEQRRASEEMLSNAESALGSCQHVHRSTEEQRSTSRYITEAISGIRDMIRAIGEQTTVHARASENVSAAVLSLLDNAKRSGESLAPIRRILDSLQTEALGLTGAASEAACAPSEEPCAVAESTDAAEAPREARASGIAERNRQPRP
jgi:methyl-accepting chemotaxis protein